MRTLASAALLLLVAQPNAPDDLLRLPIGDPVRRGRDVAITLDAVTDTATPATLTPSELADRLKRTRLVIVGETHTDIESHRVQLRVIDALHGAGRTVIVGVEMYPYTEQPHLDAWVQGTLDEEAFLRASRWYHHWGYHWQYYRDIFVRARHLRLPVVALNTPRDVITAVRKKGLKNLTREEAAHMPAEIDTSSADHLRLFRALLQDSDGLHAGALTDVELQGMFAAQCAWDASMAHHAVQALAGRGPDAVVVVLAGAGHAAYGLGIARQAARWFDGGIATVMPTSMMDEQRRRIDRVQASYADFIWGVPGPPLPLFPSLGVATRELPAADGLEVLDVEKDSPAAVAGIAAGDVILEIDGTPVPHRETLNGRIAGKQWADDARLAVRRVDKTLTVRVVFRRTVESP